MARPSALNLLFSDERGAGGRKEAGLHEDAYRRLADVDRHGGMELLGGVIRTISGEARSPKTAPRLDLLLAGKGGLPLAAELKAGDDRDPFYALIQALAHA